MSNEREISVITIKGEGEFLGKLQFGNRLEALSIEFSEGETIKWHDKVYKELPVRIGLYAIIDEEEEVIYIGKATGKGGLKERHMRHEKKELFKLFDAKKVIVYFADGKDVNDEGILMLLERYMIYTHQPTLNNDVKEYRSLQFEISEKMLEKISDKGLQNQELYKEFYKSLNFLFEEAKKAERDFKDALIKDAKCTDSKIEDTVLNEEEHKTIEDLNLDYKGKLKKLKEFNSENVKHFNEMYEKLSN
ncbi:hypothetical protein [Bacillus cereus]|uniref:hypothetical protein n=1 Tax=Bacillus cereus TaxID=1396 RepID=UPI000BFB90EA|nr:hypothetical protein [Bacillus cereus]PGY11983.1 hypothetical protein COE23_18465 [Bacillus cereus]